MTASGLAILGQGFLGWSLFTIACYRCHLQTSGERDLAAEFKAYGLPAWTVVLISIVEFGVAVLFTAGMWVDKVVLPTAGPFAAMMIVAVACRVKARERLYKAVPAAVCGFISGYVLVSNDTAWRAWDWLFPFLDQIAPSGLVNDNMMGFLATYDGRLWLTVLVGVADLIGGAIIMWEYLASRRHDTVPETSYVNLPDGALHGEFTPQEVPVMETSSPKMVRRKSSISIILEQVV